MKLTIGADPELWIKDRSTGQIISAYGLFPGTKDNPHPVTHGAVQVDGMAAEYNIKPASTKEEYVAYHLSVLRDLRDLIKELNPDLDFEFSFVPVADFGEEFLAAQPEEATRLGCTPDYNAYNNGQANPTPDAETPFRTSSFHIHLGWTEDQEVMHPEHIEACCMMAKQLDGYLGARCVLEEDHKNNSAGSRRRALYGKAGAFRPKSYGMEYRTMSSYMLGSIELLAATFEYAEMAFNDLIGGYQYYNDYPMQSNINNHNLYNTGYYTGRVHSYRFINMDTLDRLYDDYKWYLPEFDAGGQPQPLVAAPPAPWEIEEEQGPLQGWQVVAQGVHAGPLGVGGVVVDEFDLDQE